MSKPESWKNATAWEMQAQLKAYQDTGLTPDEVEILRSTYDPQDSFMAIINAQRERISHLIAELERYKKWVNDLQSGMYVNCVYCGHRYGPAEETPVSMADVLKAHIEHCPEHPMSKLKADLTSATAERNAAEKCIRDIETYLELGSGRYIKKTIGAWRSRHEAGEDGRDG